MQQKQIMFIKPVLKGNLSHSLKIINYYEKK